MRSFRVFRGKPRTTAGAGILPGQNDSPLRKAKPFGQGEICRENRPHIDTTLSYHKISVNSTHKLRKSLQTPITGVAAHPGRGGGNGLSAVNRSHSRLQIVTLCQVLFFHRQNACGKNYGSAKSAGSPKGTKCALCQANRQMFDRNRSKKFLWKTLWRMWKTQCYPHLSAAVSTAVKFENRNLHRRFRPPPHGGSGQLRCRREGA